MKLYHLLVCGSIALVLTSCYSPSPEPDTMEVIEYFEPASEVTGIKTSDIKFGAFVRINDGRLMLVVKSVGSTVLVIPYERGGDALIAETIPLSLVNKVLLKPPTEFDIVPTPISLSRSDNFLTVGTIVRLVDDEESMYFISGYLPEDSEGKTYHYLIYPVTVNKSSLVSDLDAPSCIHSREISSILYIPQSGANLSNITSTVISVYNNEHETPFDWEAK
jgi:hypothetical protein